jgi:hypothetical protein
MMLIQVWSLYQFEEPMPKVIERGRLWRQGEEGHERAWHLKSSWGYEAINRKALHQVRHSIECCWHM